MKIVIWNECYISGGADWSMIDLVESWPDKNVEFNIFVNKTHEGLDLIREKTSHRANIETYSSHLETANKYKSTLGFLGPLGRILALILALGMNFVSLFGRVSKKNCDVLILNNGGYPGGISNYVAAICARLRGVKNIHMIVRNYPLPGFKNSSRSSLFSWIISKFFSDLISVSDDLKTHLETEAGIPTNKIKRIYNGIDIENKSGAPEKNPLDQWEDIPQKVGIIGGLEERKGHDVLFKAWPEVKSKYPEAKLFVFGSSSSGDKNGLLELARSLGIDGDIVWIEFMREIGAAYQFLDVVVIPSKNFESFGRIIVESMAFGVPVIASKVGGMPELINPGVDGLLFENKNSKELSAKILELLDSSEKRSKIIEAGKKKYSSNYTSKIMAQNYYEFISR